MSEPVEWTNVRPARGTRPSNRRDLIVAAATEQFYRHGYANVSMGDIAEAVAVGPSALYRHFRNKHDLLMAVVTNTLTSTAALLDASPEDLTAAIATSLMDNRAIGVLWHRDARHLDEEAKVAVRQQFRTIRDQLTRLLMVRRPRLNRDQADLLASATLAASTSVSYHNIQLSQDQFVEVIGRILDSVTEAHVPALQPSSEELDIEPPSWSPSRRIAILKEATRLFARHGFSGVGMEDVGAAVGISGPSVYNHFASKREVLVAIFGHGTEILRADIYRDLTRATGPSDALERALTSYVDFAFENPDLVRLTVSETGQLSPAERRVAREGQRTYVDEWVQLCRLHHRDLDSTTARLRVQALFTTVNDLAATPHLRAFVNIADATRCIARAILRLDNDNPDVS